MGFTRKVMSFCTVGLVDWRSDKERTAAYTRGIRRQTRKQTKLIKKQNSANAQQPSYSPSPQPFGGTWPPPGTHPAPTPPPTTAAGWYPDQNDVTLQRYYDGDRWTEHTAPASVPPPPS